MACTTGVCENVRDLCADNPKVISDNVFKTKNGFSVKVKDLKGDTFSQSKKYLEDIAKLSLDPLLWDKVADLFKVRNCIVHAMGNIELSNDRNRLRDLVRANQGLTTGNKVFSGLEENILCLDC